MVMFTFLKPVTSFLLSSKYEIFNHLMKYMVIITYFFNFLLLILEINVILYIKCKPLHLYCNQIHYSFNLYIRYYLISDIYEVIYMIFYIFKCKLFHFFKFMGTILKRTDN